MELVTDFDNAETMAIAAIGTDGKLVDQMQCVNGLGEKNLGHAAKLGVLNSNRRLRTDGEGGQLLEDQELRADNSVEAAALVLIEKHSTQGAHAGADECAGAGVAAE